ncbi:HTH-type transcriptional repressor FabR [Allohahella sp. A8]|uniref:HTH-type transcriptional repressor FabR n=1 Tax=Allohahella sp. A8 TaxID=3141461 RepID=UPI003A80BBB1
MHGDPLDSQRILSREEKKRQTRQSLVDAALTLVGNGENFTGISIREVAKNAGVVPTSFYRHFTDMEELGLDIVDDLGMMLRRKLRGVRQADGYSGELTRSSVELFTDFVCRHRNHFYFMYQCRAGGTVRLRAAIRNELSFFANELASDIRQLHMLGDVDSADLQMISQLIVAAVFESTTDLLDQVDSSPTFRQEFVDLTVKKLRLIWLGAERWRSRIPGN